MKKTISILLAACAALTSCESFLDREPVAEVGSGDYFKDETSLITYTNGFLEKYTPSAETLGYGDGYSDIVATKQSFTFLTNASWTPDCRPAGRQRLEADLQHQLLPGTHARSQRTFRGGLRPL